MLCIGPLPKTFALLDEVRHKLALDGENFVPTHTAISKRDNVVNLPNSGVRDEYFQIDSCNERENSNPPMPMQ